VISIGDEVLIEWADGSMTRGPLAGAGDRLISVHQLRCHPSQRLRFHRSNGFLQVPLRGRGKWPAPKAWICDEDMDRIRAAFPAGGAK
jgi:hypothetical protein